ncbi:PQQ-binding-like beta-propeller repeat protein [bacterium]|nr:PQQ-binding-like beta-propeller repeat protein [bacterium]
MGCGGGTTAIDLTNPQTNPSLDTALGQLNTWPVALPVDAAQPWEALDERGKVVTGLTPNSEFRPGVERFTESITGVTDNAEASRFTSGAAGACGLSWAYYRLPMSGIQPGVISADVNLLAMSNGARSSYYLGLADYANAYWHWSGPFSDSHVRLSTAAEIAGGSDYLSELGNLFVCCVAYDGATFDVVGLGANPLDTGDSTTPSAPTGLTAAPVAGGLELAWHNVLAGDLAGYQVYYGAADFNTPDEAGVHSLGYLVGQTSHVLAGLHELTYVRVAAVDISGNQSALSDAATGTPLGGTAPAVLLACDTPSSMLNGAIQLTATGADVYAWDLDGDGSYDVTDDTTGLQAADTTATGLIRPAVRGTTGGGECVACGAVSLIVSGNSRPAASALATPQSGPAPLEVTFSGTADDLEDEAAELSYAWDFDGDGSYEAGTDTLTPDPHTYTAAGQYNAKLRVEDSDGSWDVDTVAVQVQPAGDPPNVDPTADLQVDPAYGDEGLAVTLDASASDDTDGSIVKYEWDFDGDGQYEAYGELDTASHNYNNCGVFTAKVRVTDNGGATATATAEVRVNEMFDLDTPWPAFGRDPRHTRRSPYTGAQTNNVKWTYTTQSGVFSSPAIGTDGTVYVGSQDDKLYALNPNGTLNWSYTTGDNVDSSPAVGTDGTVYVGSSDNNLYALNPDGTLKWSYATGADVRSSPAIGADGTVYVGSLDSNVYALNPDGTLKWSYLTAGGDLHSSPAIGADGTVYIGSDDHDLYALNSDGTFKWSYSTQGVVRSSPAIGADGTVYVGSYDNKLYALNPDGTLKWSYTTGGFVHSSPAIGADGTVYAGSADLKLLALNPDGTLKWSYTVGGILSRSSPAISADGTVYFGCADNKLYALNSDGTPKWSYTTGGEVRSSPAIGADGTVYVGSLDTKLYVFGVDEGNSAPVAVLHGSPLTGEEPVEVAFSAADSYDTDGSVVDYEWDFDGDGTYNETGAEADSQGLAAPALQTYNAGPPVTARVRITDDGGLTDTASLTVTAHGWVSLAVDTNNDVGQYTSLAVVNGRPAISYYHVTNGNLKYVRAADAYGDAWDSPSAVETTSDVGLYTSLAIVNGNPAISYYEASSDNLKYIRATDADGSSWGLASVPDATGDVGLHTSLAVVNGNPAISYYDATNGDLKYVRAANATGSSWGTPVVLASTGDAGLYTSLAVVNGNPAVSYLDASNLDLRYVRGTDAGGSAWGTPQSLDSAGRGYFCSLAVVDGNPAISYLDTLNQDLKYVRATDASGTAWDTPVSVDTAGDVGRYTSLAVISGYPAISYYNSANGDLKFVWAADAGGSTWDTPIAIDTTGDVGQYTSLVAIGSYPAISYYDVTNGDLKFARLY